MSNRRQFLEQTRIVIGALLTPVAGRKGFARASWLGFPEDASGGPRFEFKPEAGTWSVNAEGKAPWSASDLSISIEINGQEHRFAGPAEARPDSAPDTDVLGAGRSTRYTLPPEGNRPTLSVVVTAYEQPARLRLHYEIENDTGKDIRIGQVTIRALLSSPGWDKPLRVFINSGSQGFSGSRPLEQGGNSAYLGMLTPRSGGSNLLAGFISYRRTDGYLSFKHDSGDRVEFKGSAPYNNLRLPARQKLLGEDLELLAGLNTFELVEGYATDVARMCKIEFNRDLTSFWNVGYSHGDPIASSVTEKQMLEAADALDKTLGKYGVRYLNTCVWQNRGAFGERNPWPGKFPDGLHGTARALHRRGYGQVTHSFMAKVSSCTEVFERHPEWLIHDSSGKPIKRKDKSWHGCPYPSYDLDITHPGAVAWFRDWARDMAAGGLVNYIVLDFEGTGAGVLYDDTICGPFETDRRRVGIVRETLGRKGKIGTLTSPTNRHLGLVDRVRLGLDVGRFDRVGAEHDKGLGEMADSLRFTADERWKHVMECARNMSAGYFYHGKFWLNDPDPSMVGDHDLPQTLEEGRCRLMYTALTGSFVTIGQTLAEVAPSRLRLLKMSLPPMGMAARPLDLFRADVASMYHWHLKAGWDEWHVLTLINWEPDQERTFNLRLADLGIVGKQWVYELWTDHYLGEVTGTGVFTVTPRASRVFAIRPKRSHPWFLATDLHVGMGYHELKQVKWNASRRVLSGIVERPSDMPGHVFAVVPRGWRLVPGSTSAEMDGDLLRIPVDFRRGPMTLSLHFESLKDI